jgi:hypothetical protein
VAVWKLEFNLLGNTLGCSLDGVPEIWFWMSQMSAGPAPVWQVVSKSERHSWHVGGRRSWF